MEKHARAFGVATAAVGVLAGLMAAGCSSGAAAPGPGGDDPGASVADGGVPGNPGNPGNPGGPSDAGGAADVLAPADAGLPSAGNPNMPPVPVPVAGAVASGVCVPLCANSSSDPDGDGWGYEKGASCVVPGSANAAIRLPCQVGAPLPPPGHPAGSAGVVVAGACVALCGPAVVDSDGDGYGYEFDSSCVMRGSTVAATSFTCTTGGPITTGSNTGAAGRLLAEVCVPLCTSAASDPDGDGFGFEFGASCVMTGSTASMRGLDCKVGVPEPTGPPFTLNPSPPPGQVQKPAGVASRGFFVSGGRLYDKFGNDFVMRGINSPDIWFDASDQYFAYNALDNMAAGGVNAVRIVWLTSGTTPLLRRVIRRVVELRMVPMIELHDATGGTSDQALLDMADYYSRSDVKQVLTDFEEFLLINIANEWSGTDFRGGYQAAVSRMRQNGLNHALVIDANGFGQNAASVFTDGPALLTADPQHNLVFSVHMYDVYSTARGGGRPKITQTLEQAVSAHLPLVIGEFGWQAGAPPVAVDSDFIMAECVRLGIGYLAWSWKGNETSLSYLDLAIDWEGQQLSSWGTSVIKGSSGITATSKKATIYTE
jgi:mannan endo-1,4-beta-mannosidase